MAVRSLLLLALLFASACGQAEDAALPAAEPSKGSEALTPAYAVPDGACGASGPGYGPGSAATDPTVYEGLALANAEALAEQRGVALVVVGTDGVCSTLNATADLRSNRVRVYLDSGTVLSAYTG